MRALVATVGTVCALAVACSDDSPDHGAGAASGGQGGDAGMAGNGGNPGGGGQGGAPTCLDEPSLCTGATPVCNDDGTCVECTPSDDTLCMGQTPYCNPTTFECEACSYHEHCPESACNPFTGACLNATPQTVASGALAAAIAGVADDGEGVFLVDPAGTFTDGITVGNNKTIAVFGDGGRPVLTDLAGGDITFTVNLGATLVLQDVDLKSNPTRALQVDGRLALDLVKVSLNAGGGILAGSSAELLIRSSMIAANGDNENAIELGQGTLELLYSGVGGSLVGSSAAVTCTSGQLTVRNSILFNRNANPTVTGCSSPTISYTAADGVLAGTGNVDFGDPEQLPTPFVDHGNGDLRLTATGATLFADVALWQTGDPTMDIEGALRPTTPDSPDVAGADLGP